MPASSRGAYTRENGKSNCSRIQRVQPESIDPPYLIPQANLRRANSRCGVGDARDGLERDAELGRKPPDTVDRRVRRADVEGLTSSDGFPRGEQPVHRAKGIVRFARDRESSGCAVGGQHATWRGRDVPLGDVLERAGESLEDAIELDAHLERQRPARIVVRRGRRRARVGNDVRMILRLEHVEHVRPERLRGHHDERARWIALVRDVEVTRRAKDVDANCPESVHELCRRRKVSLRGRDDVSARVAQLRLPERGPGVALLVSAAGGDRPAPPD